MRFSKVIKVLVAASVLSLYFSDAFAQGGVRELIREKIKHKNRDKRSDTSKINTSGWQDTPFLTSDGQRLFFSYSPHDFLRAQKTRFRDIRIRGPVRPGHTREEYATVPQTLVVHNYVASRYPDGTWGPPQPLHFDGGDAVGGSMGVSEDGDTLYLAGWGKPGRENYGSGDIYVSTRRSDNHWTMPINPGTAINTKYLEDNPHISADGKTLYFDSDRPGGYGRWDIYYCLKNDDGTWSAPVNLGPLINTGAVEGMPYLSTGGNTLYFVRGDPGKRMPTQIFSSKKSSDGSWSKPVLVDVGMVDISSPSLNREENELYFLKIDYQTGNLYIWVSRRSENGAWELARPVD